MDMQQVWFAGAHSNIGGSYKPDKDGALLSDNALLWMISEAQKFDLSLEPHLAASVHPSPLATLHDSRRSFYRIKQEYLRPLDPALVPVLLHHSVKARWDQDPKYRPKNLQTYIEHYGWPEQLV